MPDSDAAPGLSAAERTERPKRVRFSRNASSPTIAGTATRTSSWSPRTVSEPMFQRSSIGVGYDTGKSIWGSWSWRRRITCATPTVATNSKSRGWLNSRRTTRSSVRPPITAPDRIASGTVTAEGDPFVHVEHGEERRAERAELALREVDDARRPEHQDDADREQRVDQPDHDAVEHDL